MKIKSVLTFTYVIVLCASFTFAQDKSAEIKQQSKQLSDVKKSIQQKQIEKDRLVMQEKVFKRELKTLNESIEKNEKNISKIANDIKTAEKNLSKASNQYNTAYQKQNDWNQSVLDEIELYNKKTFEVSYEKDPVEYKIREAALQYKKENFDKESKAVDISASDIKKWEKAKSELLSLRQQENKYMQERKKLMAEKNKLLKSTSGRRAAAEEEIKTLNESAKAMQNLIKKLSETNKQKPKETVIRTPSSGAKRKKSLPWPVEGKVAVKFGKSKHPELDTYVISNGIKIKAADFSEVKSVDSGQVVFTGEFRSYGKVVIIDHRDSYFSVYGQLGQILVKDDQKVSRGTVLAKLGKSGESILYFEIRQDNSPDDPLLWLKAK